MPIEVLDVLDPASWHAYGMVYGFVGNELLTPMNRSHNLQGLDPGFWATMPRPETADGIDPLNGGKVGYGRATVAMQRLLAEEGLELSGRSNQYEDHMGVELLYLAALCEKAASRLAGADQPGSEAAKEVAGKVVWFIQAHPQAWIGNLRKNVDAERPDGYYSALLEYVDGALQDHSASIAA